MEAHRGWLDAEVEADRGSVAHGGRACGRARSAGPGVPSAGARAQARHARAL